MALRCNVHLDAIIGHLAKNARLDGDLVWAVVLQESGGNTRILGDGGHSVGLMQLHDQGAGAGMSVEERQDPFVNVSVGTAYLAQMVNATGSYGVGLVAYNMGFGGWENAGRPTESGYSRAVLSIMARIRAEGYHLDFDEEGLPTWI